MIEDVIERVERECQSMERNKFEVWNDPSGNELGLDDVRALVERVKFLTDSIYQWSDDLFDDYHRGGRQELFIRNDLLRTVDSG